MKTRNKFKVGNDCKKVGNHCSITSYDETLASALSVWLMLRTIPIPSAFLEDSTQHMSLVLSTSKKPGKRTRWRTYTRKLMKYVAEDVDIRSTALLPFWCVNKEYDTTGGGRSVTVASPNHPYWGEQVRRRLAKLMQIRFLFASIVSAERVRVFLNLMHKGQWLEERGFWRNNWPKLGWTHYGAVRNLTKVFCFRGLSPGIQSQIPGMRGIDVPTELRRS